MFEPTTLRDTIRNVRQKIVSTVGPNFCAFTAFGIKNSHEVFTATSITESEKLFSLETPACWSYKLKLITFEHIVWLTAIKQGRWGICNEWVMKHELRKLNVTNTKWHAVEEERVLPLTPFIHYWSLTSGGLILPSPVIARWDVVVDIVCSSLRGM